MPSRAQVHIDRALTNISVAYIQSADSFVAHQVFPVVGVQKQSDRYFKYNRDDWFRDEAEERGPATESAGGDYDIDNTPSYFCKKYAYHKDVTDEDRTNSDTPLNADQDATEFVTGKLLLKKEVQWANTYFKTGVWATDITGVTGTNTDAAKVQYWNESGSTPIQDFSLQKTNMAALTGQRPNILVLGAQVYEALKNHKDILDRIRYTQKGIVTPDLLAALFDVERVVIAWAVKNSAAKGAAESNSFILGKGALLAYSAPRPALKTATAGYTFAWTGLKGANAFGGTMGRIEMPWLGAGTERIEGELAYDMKVVASDLGTFFSGCVA
jgi:hypothetical protein